MSDESGGCREYQELSRRGFMAMTGGTAAFLVAAQHWLPRVALATDYRSSMRDVIVSVYLRGASDGMTFVPPYAENNYYASRPTLALPRPDSGDPDRCIDLNGFFGLAPQLAPLLQAYNDDNLLIVHATSSNDTSRSHFDAQRSMEVGKVNDPTLGTGWLGRHLASVAPMDPSAMLRAVGISSGLQKTLVGGPKTLPIPNLAVFGLTGNVSTKAARSAAIGDMYSAVPDPLRASGMNTLQTISLLESINFNGYIPGGGAVYPAGNFGYSMKTTAALIKAQIGIEAVALDVFGWDTHAQQGNTGNGQMSTLMSMIANTLSAFYTDMTSGSNPPNFIVVVMSEFGRRLRENGTFGTDHGYGNAMFIMGQCVRGGRVLADWPGLNPDQLFQGIDLRMTIDYRDLLAEIVQQRLGNNNLGYVFPQYTPTNRGITDNC